MFSSWLGRIVIYSVRHYLRRQQPMRRHASGGAVNFEALVSPLARPDVMLELEMLRRALERLPEKPRAALVLRRIESHSVSEIAARMNVSESTIERWLCKAEVQLNLELRKRTRQNRAGPGLRLGFAKRAGKPRKEPRQRRSILIAAARILPARGVTRATTNQIAGV